MGDGGESWLGCAALLPEWAGGGQGPCGVRGMGMGMGWDGGGGRGARVLGAPGGTYTQAAAALRIGWRAADAASRQLCIARQRHAARDGTGQGQPAVDDASALFSSEKISDFATITLLFLFDKYFPIIN